ncbi:MAG TPA: ATP-binding protein [Nitratifractor sp.]|nr:ATP-binding protein [Nitratifractor sp.]
MENEEKKSVIVNRLKSATLDGVTAKVVEVEGSLTKGLPGFNVVGLASSDIQEAKERAKNALLALDFELPPKKITINLSPSDIKKSGTHFDLAIALLVALGKVEISHDIFVFGELGLDGRVKSSSLIFPLILSLKEQGLISRAIVPKDALGALEYIKGVSFYGVETLSEAAELLAQENLALPQNEVSDYSSQYIELGSQRYYYTREYPLDFSDIKGQKMALRAALIAAAGMHNILLNGSPGSGKSMIANRLRYILPPLTQEEILSISKHQFLAGQEPDFKPLRPFRSPHHTATSAAIFGGGSHSAKIGEVALANYGVLFFDELPHFKSTTLEALREPMQDRVVNIARVNSKVQYDANFLFVGAMNPCPCGNLLSKSKECRCSQVEIARYQNRLSDPFLDRIELFVVMQEVDFTDTPSTTSEQTHTEVLEAFQKQISRQGIVNGFLNEAQIDKHCHLDNEAQEILHKATLQFALSHRSIANIKKVARTIADLNSSELIDKSALLEALSFRKR